jgi:hypothetical protein
MNHYSNVTDNSLFGQCPLYKNCYHMNKFCVVRFQVITVVSVKMTAFWDVALCSLVEVDQHFRGVYCLHHHPDDGGSTHL